ncbi:MAG: hypothetical protein IIC82_03895 [Chloroflexi bacterium]|nr:hypothetical protein [Chloroflexota bacterium]
MQYIKDLTEVRAVDVPLVGGKGANLGELVSLGIPVPPGFCITTEAYEAFIQANDLGPAIRDATTAIQPGDPQSTTQASQRIRSLIEAAPVPTAIGDEVRQAYAALGEGSVAVRSSATAEDLPEASFAGQHESRLNVTGVKAVTAAVKSTWASLWAAAAIQYRADNGYDHHAVSMAVVAQRMLEPDTSGVLYTVNPLSGDTQRVVIHATYGLGEGLVSGETASDIYRVNKKTRVIDARAISKKGSMTVAAATGGTATEAVPEAMANAVALSDDEARALAVLGQRVEEHYGTPMDIEWCIVQGEAYLVQARPMTAVPVEQQADEWENPVPGAKWRRNWRVGEWLSDPVTPLFATLLLPVLVAGREEQGFNHLGWNIPKAFMMPQPWYCILNGYFFTRADPPNMGGARTDMAQRSRMLTDRMGWYKEWERTHLPAYLERLAGFQAMDLSAASSDDIMSRLDELCKDAGEWWYLQAPIGYGFEQMFFGGLYNQKITAKDKPLYMAFFSGYDSEILKGQRTLHAIYRETRANEALREVFEGNEPQAVLEALDSTAAGRVLLGKLHGYWADYGHQISSFDLFFPTSGEAPEVTVRALQSYLEADPPDPAKQLAEQEARRATAVALFHQALADISPEDAETLRRLLEWHQLCASMREDIAFHFQKLWPLMRAGVMELARRLNKSGVLDSPGLVFFLNKDEVWGVARGMESSGTVASEGLTSLAMRRMKEWQDRRRLSPPDRIPPADDPAWEGPIPGMNASGLKTGEDGRYLVGQGASPGRITARARVLHSTDELGSFQRGEVLVTAAASPAWTLLFPLAAAVVADTGGGATHSSMVAREYGIPAVMGTGVATQQIKDGDTITVDGTEGIVYLDSR